MKETTATLQDDLEYARQREEQLMGYLEKKDECIRYALSVCLAGYPVETVIATLQQALEV